MFLFLFDVYIINCQNANKTTNIDARNYWLIFLSITFPYHLNSEWLMFCRYGNLYLLESIKIVLSFDFVKIWICMHLWWTDFLIQSDHLIIRQGYTSTLCEREQHPQSMFRVYFSIFRNDSQLKHFNCCVLYMKQ